MLALEGCEVTAAHSLTTCDGDCELTVHDVTIKADEINFHQDTSEAEALGNFRLVVTPHRPSLCSAISTTVLSGPNGRVTALPETCLFLGFFFELFHQAFADAVESR